METYFCVFKMPDQQVPTRHTFQAEHNGLAIMKLMQVANVSSSVELEQAQLLKLVKGKQGNAYVEIYVKEKDEPKGRIKFTTGGATAPIIDAAVIDKQVEVVDVYIKPYKTEVL